MKYMRGFGIILGVTFLAEAARFLLPLPVPAGIYGLIFMLAALISGMIKSEWVREAGGFLIDIMPLLFIPAAAGLIASASALEGILLKALALILVTTVLVMVVTGLSAQWVMRRAGRGGK